MTTPEQQREWRKANLAKARASSRAWKKAHAADVAAYDKTWAESNRDQKNQHSRKTRKTHPLTPAQKKQAVVRTAAWIKKHPEYKAAINHRRHAQKMGNGGTWTAAEWMTLKRQLGFRCVGCRLPEIKLWCLRRRLVPDHIVPLTKGGLNVIENLQPLCHGTGGCNNKKGSKTQDFLIS